VADPILVPVSAGELFDKKTILEIKRARISDTTQLENVGRELTLLSDVVKGVLAGLVSLADIERLETELKSVNEALWDLENEVRACERAGNFGASFINAARRIYAGNDHRAAVKRRINVLLHSSIVEEKKHE
jgi:hypothetical protein